MPRFDVYPMPGTRRSGYIVDVQADFLSDLATRVVVPLMSEEKAPKPLKDLNPIFEIRGKRHVLLIQAMASIPRRELKESIASLAGHHEHVIRALDILLTGF